MQLNRTPNDTKRHEMIMFIGRDGKDYATPEGLRNANDAWKQAHLRFKVYDALRGTFEVAPGIGEIQVYVGYKIEHTTDPNGIIHRRDVPVFRTERY
jgi:hypothetical protein